MAGLTYAQAVARVCYQMAIEKKNVVAMKLVLDRLAPAPDTRVTVNQLFMRKDLNERLVALKECDIDRLLPA